jgi:acyl-coenzyme A thioesterase 13
MSLTDTLGSLAVASHGQYMTGVSTDISTSFVKPAGKPGDELRMVATLTAMGASNVMLFPPSCLAITQDCDCSTPGKSLAYTRVDFTDPAGQLVAYGSESPRPLFVPPVCLANGALVSPYEVCWQVDWTLGTPSV